MVDVGRLDELATWMRKNGAIRARVGTLELELSGSAPDDEPSEEAIAVLQEQSQEETRDFRDPQEDPDLYGGKVPGWGRRAES